LIALIAAVVLSAGSAPVAACTRVLYVVKDGTVITGRSMDRGEDLRSNLWVLPRGLKQEGMGGKTYRGNGADRVVEAKLFDFAALGSRYEAAKERNR